MHLAHIALNLNLNLDEQALVPLLALAVRAPLLRAHEGVASGALAGQRPGPACRAASQWRRGRLYLSPRCATRRLSHLDPVAPELFCTPVLLRHPGRAQTRSEEHTSE